MKDKLNVCLLNDSFVPAVDGVVNVIRNYASVINESYGSASVVAPSTPGFVDDFPYDVVRYPSVNTTRLFGYRSGDPFDSKLIDTLSGKNFNIIHSHCPFASGYAARLLRYRTNTPLVFTYHTKFDYDIKRVIALKGVQNAAVRMALSNIAACDEVWTVSHGASENLYSLGYEGECVVMNNGVDLPQGRLVKKERRRIDELHSLPQGVPLYLFVGRMQWYKGIRLILEALDMVKRQGRDFRMIFVGTGMEENEIKAYCRKLGVDDKCIFAGVVRDRQLIRAYFSRCDLFLFPSMFDTNGLVVREAAACGLASVLIKGSCASEGVTDGKNALLIEESAAALASLLLDIDEKYIYMKALGDNAMKDLYISWDDAVASAVERYNIVLDRAAEKRSCGIALKEDKAFIAYADSMLRGVTKIKGLPKEIRKRFKS